MEENKKTNENEQPKEQVQQNQNVDPIKTAGETSTNNFNNVSSEENTKKKGKKGLIALLIVAIILIIAIVAGLAYYFTVYTKPEQIYKRLVGSALDSYTDELQNVDYVTSKTSLKLDVDLETDSDEIDEDIIDLINKINVGMDLQTDNEDKQLLINLEADYDNEDLLNFQMYSDIDEEKTYMQLENLLDKYIEVEDIDDEFYSTFSEALENQKNTIGEKVSLQKAMKIIKKEFTNTIKKEYCSAQKEDITVNGKTISTTKNTIKMTAKQLKDEYMTVFKNLKDNEEFINCFEEKEDVTQTLEDLISQMEDFSDDDESTVAVSIYTNGIMQKVAKFDISVYSEEDDETVTIAFTKTAENVYNFEALTEKETVCTGILNIENKNETEGTIKLEFDVSDFGKIKLNMDYSQKYNEEIDNVDVENSVKADELTSADQKTLATNLQKSKLYELIESFSGSSSSSLTGNITNSNITTNIDDEEDDDETTTSSTKDNEIISYDDKTKITFKIPTGYESGYASDNYKSLDKDDISIKVSSKYSDKDKYYASLEDTKKYYEKESNYKNAELSDMQTIEVNGRTFYCATFSYEYSGVGSTTKYETKYIWTEISDKYVLDFEIRGSESMTEEELNELLTITVEDNK